jgi:hypothetical protein
VGPRAGLDVCKRYLCNKHEYSKVYLINRGFLNTNTAITRQLMLTARTLEAEWWKVLRGSVSTGAKEDETCTFFFIENQEPLHVSSSTCSFAGSGAQW